MTRSFCFQVIAGLGLLVAPLARAQTDSTVVRADTTQMVAAPATDVAEVPVVSDPTGPEKDVALGYVLGYIVPGGGHFYAGETATGAAVIGTGLVGYGLLLSSSVSIWGGADSADVARAGAGFALVVGAAVFSVVDGGRAVRRTNRRNGYAAAPRAMVVPAGAGVAMRVRL